MGLKKNSLVFSNMLWRFGERLGAKAVAFVVELILARMLGPKAFAMVALITIFTTILQVFVDSGLGNALIQKKDADDVDFSTVFYINIGMCLFLYAIIFIIAPLIASFYHNPDMTAPIRVLGLTIIISGVKNVQQAYVSRNMLFKRFFFATLGGTIGAAIIGILMAYLGFGVWALVAQMLFNNLVDTIILWITVKWRPKKVFSFDRFKGLFSYGWKLLVSSLIDTVYNDLRQLIIGKRYLDTDLAQYNQGKKFPMYLVTNINASIDSVLLPTMSEVQDNKPAIKSMTRRAIKTSTYIMMPFMVGLAVCAYPLVHIILGDEWLPCVPFLRIFCFSYAFYPIHTANLNAIKAMGRSDIFLKLEVIKKIIGIITILITMWISVMAMAYSLLFISVVSQILNSWPNKKLMNYSYYEQFKDLMPQLLLSVVMGVVVCSVQFLGLNDILSLLIQIPLGISIYLFGSKVLHLDSFEYIISTVKGLLGKGKKTV